MIAELKQIEKDGVFVLLDFYFVSIIELKIT
jgi:hypothetical protein